MLCDRLILAARNPSKRRASSAAYMQHVAKLVGEAERFSLDHEAVDVVLDVQETKPSSLVAGLGICRLPYRKVWVEFDCKYRMDAMARYGYIPDYPAHFTSVPKGMLLIASDDTFLRGAMYLVVAENNDEPWVNPQSFEFDFSPMAQNRCFERRQKSGKVSSAASVELDTYFLKPDDYSVRFLNNPHEQAALADIENIFYARCDDLARDWMETLRRNVSAERLKKIIEVFHTGYRGEPRFMLGIMMLLNSRNLVQSEERSVRDKNRSRGVRGDRAVVSHRSITIKLSKVSQNRMAAQGIATNDMPLHKVRGHWKIRKTGVFFWRPFKRGRRAHGEITHDYLVTA